MTDPRAGRKSQLIIWAAAEARRLRGQEAVMADTLARRATLPTAEAEVDQRADVRGLVLDWQLAAEPPTSGAARAGGVVAVTTPVHEPGVFAVTTAVSDGQVVLRLAGELDFDSAPRLREALDELGRRKVVTLLIDLCHLTFIDSSGLNELVLAQKRQREAGGRITLHNPSPKVKRVLDIVGLSQVFTIA